jgi:hypothetical protein
MMYALLVYNITGVFSRRTQPPKYFDRTSTLPFSSYFARTAASGTRINMSKIRSLKNCNRGFYDGYQKYSNTVIVSYACVTIISYWGGAHHAYKECFALIGARSS